MAFKKAKSPSWESQNHLLCLSHFRSLHIWADLADLEKFWLFFKENFKESKLEKGVRHFV